MRWEPTLEVTEGGGRPDVGDIRDPDPVETDDLDIFDEIRVSTENV